MAYQEQAHILNAQGIQVVNIKPAKAYEVGEIIVLGNYAYVCPMATNEATLNIGVNAWGGEYISCHTDAAIAENSDVFWNATAKKFTITAAGAVHFGRVSAGCGCTEAGGYITIIHCPNGTTLGN